MDLRSLGLIGRIGGSVLHQPDPVKNRWRIRRRLIVGTVLFGAAMIIAGAFGLFSDKFTGELVYGGVTLISAVLTAYSTMATFDDKWQGVPPEEGEKNPDG